MCFHTRYVGCKRVAVLMVDESGGPLGCRETFGERPAPAEQARRLARMEGQLFESIVREVERLCLSTPGVGALMSTLHPKRPDEEIMYNCAQLSRLSASLVISFILSGLEVEMDILSVPEMALVAAYGDASTLLKQFLAWPLSAKQGTGERPKDVAGWNYEYVFGRRFRSLVKGRILNPSTKHAEESLIWAECMLRCKRSAYEVSPVAILKAMQDHGEEIGKPDKPVFYHEEMERVKKWIDIVVGGIIPTQDFGSLDPVIPPGTACFEKTRSKGGCAHGAMTDDTRFSNLMLGVGISEVVRRELHSMHYTPRHGVVSIYCRPSEYTTEDFFVNREHSDYNRRINVLLGGGEMVGDGVDTPWEWNDVRSDPVIKATAVAILEPLKVRMITKGEAVPYLEAKRLQTQMTDWMKSCKLSRFFPALHGWISPDVLNTRFQAYLDAASGPQEVLSGDYKGATDTLRKDVSVYAIRKIIESVPEYSGTRVGALMEMCLVNHTLGYTFKGRSDWLDDGLRSYEKDEGDNDGTQNGGQNLKWSVRQEKGQLMGSYLSFPVLNVINAAVHFAFYEYSGVITDDWHSYKDAPFLVNGDDVLGVGPKGLFDDRLDGGISWEKYVGIVGFVKSLGKNYVSDSFCTVNSTLFRFRDRLPDSGPRRGFKLVACPRTERIYNTQWYQEGEKPTGSHDPVFMTNHKVGPGMVGGLVRELLLTVDPSRHELAVRTFIEINKSQLKSIGLPWFVPEDLGGLGIPCLPEMKKEWENDAKTVSYIARMWNTKDGLVKVPSANTKDCNRPCDKVRSEISMNYLKALGYRPTFVVDPTPSEMMIHDNCPKPSIDPLCLVAEGIVPGEYDEVAFQRSLREQRRNVATLIGKSSKTDLAPMNLSGSSIRVLWLPYWYKRNEVPNLIPIPLESEDVEDEDENSSLYDDEPHNWADYPLDDDIASPLSP